ncbi:amidohydrolase family protein [Aeromicrobium sp. CF4.19]|uniref:amidohydrolase family protein n=1 Tax=Aeromicrobium sp. CF4.19 TaxID=3373082 RepID=UPI003EE809C3
MIDGHRVIDAHQHLWDLEAGEYSWLTPEAGPIHRSFAVEDAEPLVAASGVDHVVLVQAAGTLADTRAMVDVADHWDRVVGIVAWAPLVHERETAAVLEDYAQDPRIVGIRHQNHDEPDPDWLLREDVGRGLALVERSRLAYDVIAVVPRHLELVPLLAERFPELPLVIDHLAKPPVGRGDLAGWAEALHRAAVHPQVSAKLSGLDTAAGPGYTAADLRPALDIALEEFGPARLMFGTDWPVSDLADGYARWWDVLGELLAPLSAPERASILGGTAADVYRIQQEVTA